MLTPLPTVETACAALEQEEAQRLMLNLSKPNQEVMDMYSRTNQERQITCNVCGVKGHTSEKCWTVVGFPRWHPRNNKGLPYRPRTQASPGQGNRWAGAPIAKPNKMAANAQVQDTTGLLFTPQ